jgi:hypothetical protein
MKTQSEVDCQKLFAEKYGIDSMGFSELWDLHFKHEVNRPFEDELRKVINKLLPNENQQEVYGILLNYYEDAKRRRRFYQRGNPHGYGYEVIDRNEGKPILKLHTYDSQKAKDYWEALRADENAVVPDTSEETPPRRALVINGKHGSCYFSVDTQEEFIKKSVDFIRENFSDVYRPSEKKDKDYLGLTNEEIKSLPEGKVKEAALEELRKFKERNKYDLLHKESCELLDEIKSKGYNSKISDIIDVLNFYQGDRYEGNWDIVDLR